MLQPSFTQTKSVNLLFLHYHYRLEYQQLNRNFRKTQPSCTNEMFEIVMQIRSYLSLSQISPQFSMMCNNHAEHEDHALKMIFGPSYNFYLLPLDQFYEAMLDLSEPPGYGLVKDLENVTSAADYAELEINTRMTNMNKVLLEFHANQSLKKNRLWKDGQFLKQLTHLIFAINHYYYLLKKCQALAQPHQGSMNLLRNLSAKEVDLMEKFLDLLQNTFMVTQEPDNVYTMPTPCQAKGNQEDDKKRCISDKTKAKSVLLDAVFLGGLVPNCSSWLRFSSDVTLYVVGQHSDNTTLASYTASRTAYTDTLNTTLREDMKIRVMKDDIVFVAQNITRTGRTKRLFSAGEKRSSEGNEARVAGGDIYTIVLEFSVAFQLHGHIEETLPGWCKEFQCEEVKGCVKTCTIPIAFIGHTDQKPAAEGYLFWTEFNPFPHTKPLYEPERVQVEQFICQIKKYTFDRTQRELSSDEVEYLLKKIPRQDHKGNNIRRDNIMRYPAVMTGRHPGNGKSFWLGWYWKVLNIIQKNKTLHDLWKRGIVSLLESEKAQTILHNSPYSGAAIIRMSETSTDGVLNLLTKQKHLKENNESTSTFQINIDNKIIESLSHDINTLKLDYFWQQGTWMSSEYVKSSRTQKMSITNSGYDDPLTVLVPRVVGMKLSPPELEFAHPRCENDNHIKFKTEIPPVESFLSCSRPSETFSDRDSKKSPWENNANISCNNFNEYSENYNFFKNTGEMRPMNFHSPQHNVQNNVVQSPTNMSVHSPQNIGQNIVQSPTIMGGQQSMDYSQFMSQFPSGTGWNIDPNIGNTEHYNNFGNFD